MRCFIFTITTLQTLICTLTFDLIYLCFYDDIVDMEPLKKLLKNKQLKF